MGVITPLAVDQYGNPVPTGSQKTLGKDEFLQLLIAKLTHQDPLNPIEDEAFVADLAQFSSLEQLSNLNESLSTSLEWDYLQMQTINNTMATSLIGKGIKATFSNMYLDSENQPKINYTTTESAEEVTISIKDADGSVVRTLTMENVPPGHNSIVWDGKDENGNRLADGFYQFEVSAVDADGGSVTTSTYVEGKVTGVIYRDGSAYLQVDGLEIPLAEVTEIFELNQEGEG
jgi:flagellar basal-body rod modification protein FlgD